MAARSVAALLCGTLVLASCDATKQKMSDIYDGTADAFGNTAYTTLGFVKEVIRVGCGDSPYAGKGLVETVALTTRYVHAAITGYGAGLGSAEVAVGLRSAQDRRFLRDYEALGGNLQLSGAFRGLETIEESSASAEALEAELAKRDAAGGLDQGTLDKLGESMTYLAGSNHFQVRAVVGLVLVGAFAADTANAGPRRVMQVVDAELGHGDARSSFQTIAASPESLAGLLTNFADAYTLYGLLNEVTDFDDARRASTEIGARIDHVIDGMERAALRQADAMGDRLPSELNYQPTGGIVTGLMSKLVAASPDPTLRAFGGIGVQTVMMACGGAFGGAQTGATGGGGAYAPVAGMSEGALVREAQEHLIALGLLQGSADGSAGPRTRAAVREAETRLGLVPTGEITPALVERLREARRPGRGLRPDGSQPMPPAAQPSGGLGGLLDGILKSTIGTGP